MAVMEKGRRGDGRYKGSGKIFGIQCLCFLLPQGANPLLLFQLPCLILAATSSCHDRISSLRNHNLINLPFYKLPWLWCFIKEKVTNKLFLRAFNWSNFTGSKMLPITRWVLLQCATMETKTTNLALIDIICDTYLSFKDNK